MCFKTTRISQLVLTNLALWYFPPIAVLTVTDIKLILLYFSGFTFSFPSKQLALNSCALLTWTKSFKCTDGVGMDPVKLLQEALEKHGLVSCVVNVSSSPKARWHSKNNFLWFSCKRDYIYAKCVHLRENVIQNTSSANKPEGLATFS